MKDPKKTPNQIESPIPPPADKLGLVKKVLEIVAIMLRIAQTLLGFNPP